MTTGTTAKPKQKPNSKSNEQVPQLQNKLKEAQSEIKQLQARLNEAQDDAKQLHSDLTKATERNLKIPLGDATGYCSRQVNTRLNREQAEKLDQIFNGLNSTDIRLESGKHIDEKPDVIRYLIELAHQIGQPEITKK